MRRAQTKIPFAYFRTATRKRGRPVHRIYAATPRPDMQGTFALWISAFFFTLGYQMAPGEQWWLQQSTSSDIQTRYNDLAASATPGRLWNQIGWDRNINTFADWSGVFDPGIGVLAIVVEPIPTPAPDFSFVL